MGGHRHEKKSTFKSLKIFALITIIVLQISIAPAVTAKDVRNAKLDATYDDDRLRLVPAPILSLSAEDFEFSDMIRETLGEVISKLILIIID